MDALVWVESWQVQSTGEWFELGQRVTWPCVTRSDAAAFTELVGADTAARVSLGVDWHARRPGDTTPRTGTVETIVGYRSRLALGHVVPGTVETRPVARADGWESEEGGLISMGYLVKLTNVD